MWNISRAIRKTRPPAPAGQASFDHGGFAPVLLALQKGGLAHVALKPDVLEGYIETTTEVDPDALSRNEALAFWLNLYNAGAIRLAVKAMMAGHDSVLRLPGAFGEAFARFGGENLSLDAIEHGKVRRFGDPRVHTALVCGSISCPTVRFEPYTGLSVDDQLDNQIRSFLAGGGAVLNPDRSVSLSRILHWYGADFVRPHRMPTLLPSARSSVLQAIQRWLPDEMRGSRRVAFQPYDWGLGCSIG